MTILEIVTWPDKRLTETSIEVKEVTKEVQNFMDDMLETMYSVNGLGISAVQVGRMERIVTIDVEKGNSRYESEEDLKKEHKPNPIFMVNPIILKEAKEPSTFNEGCLSFPDQYSKVTRPETVKIEYLDYNGKKQQMEAEGLLATCIQHEIDHLNGIVFIDHISRLKRSMIVKKLQKMGYK